MVDHFEHKKSLGQHFLNSDVVPRWLCDAAELHPDEVVLEIGPGTGALTRELLARGVRVIALEADTRAITILTDTFADELASNRLTIHHTDVRTLDLSTLGLQDQQFKVVANIPYYLSGFLFRTLLEAPIQPNTLVFLTQKEVAKRATSSLDRGDKESLLSLSVQAFGTPRYVRTVTSGHFTPPPKVDSGIIAISNISRAAFTNIDQTFFFDVLHLGFGQKRKQLLGNLSKTYDREQLTHIFSTSSLSLSTRAEDVPLEKWLILVEKLSALS